MSTAGKALALQAVMSDPLSKEPRVGPEYHWVWFQKPTSIKQTNMPFLSEHAPKEVRKKEEAGDAALLPYFLLQAAPSCLNPPQAGSSALHQDWAQTA